MYIYLKGNLCLKAMQLRFTLFYMVLVQCCPTCKQKLPRRASGCPGGWGFSLRRCHVPKGRVFAISRAMFISTSSFHRVCMEKDEYADLTVQ